MKNVKDEVLNLIRQLFGDSTEVLYRQFYEKKDDKSILLSTKELLIDVLGEDKANEKLNIICQKYNIKI